MATTRAVPGRRPPTWTWSLILGCAVLVALFAWSTDDAEISYRVVENFISGHGPVFNRDERVMVFTNPLWFLALSALRFLTRLHPHWCAIALGLTCTVAALLVVRRMLQQLGFGAAFAFSVFTALAATSFTFLAFQTSGLENSLTHLLFVLAVAAFIADDLQWASNWLWLGLLNRLDQAPLLAPLFVATALLQWRKEGFRRALRVQALASLPLIGWELFSAVYYGFLIPNTAVAKLWPLNEWRERGLHYILDLLRFEPTHAAVLCAFMAAAVWQWFRSRGTEDRAASAALLLVGGALLQALYVIGVGGDFMRGRFLTSAALALALAGALALSRQPLRWAPWQRGVAVALGLACVADLSSSAQSPAKNWYSGKAGDKTRRWIANEWVMYAGRSSLLRAPFARLPPFFSRPERDDPGKQMTFYVSDGDSTERYPPNVKWLMKDWAFITDPFTARIPYYNPNSNVGHVLKPVPMEYLAMEKASLDPRYAGIDRAALEAAYRLQRARAWEDPMLQRLFFVITAIVRQPVFSELRWRALLLYFGGGWRSLTAEELRPFQEAHRPYW